MLKPLLLVPVSLFLGVAGQPPASPVGAAPSAAAASVPAAAPAAADGAAMANPLKATPETLARGRKMYGYDCAMCHGANGDGKGELVADMKLSLKDYTDPAALKDVSDGQMFAIIRDGRGQMTGEGARAKPDDIWSMVVLVRSFSQK
jgi:mono/diheme cytochrome c family protein